ncbi:MAG: hypothetical protein EPN23_04015 [Verrucomicrobia bacterium]|nr:MAG: hypothetical protein EPN23_04015 [Verrucomicrobiota bacterium]
MAETASRRFVLLRHTGHGPLHFDLMIEDGKTLATWQFEFSPVLLAPGTAVACRRLAAHRTAYLDYTGPVSRNRGQVHRTDTGICNLTFFTSHWDLEFRGTILRGPFTLKGVGGADWLLARSA